MLILTQVLDGDKRDERIGASVNDSRSLHFQRMPSFLKEDSRVRVPKKGLGYRTLHDSFERSFNHSASQRRHRPGVEDEKKISLCAVFEFGQ